MMGLGVSSPEVERPAKIFGMESCHETEWGVEHVRLSPFRVALEYLMVPETLES